MEQFPDWVSMVNVNLADHEARMRAIERGDKQCDIPLDDPEYTWPPGQLIPQPYDLRTLPERQAARLDNHDQRLRAIEHRLMLIEVEIRELVSAIKAAGSL